jgi:integrase
MKQKLTDKHIKGLKPKAAPYDEMDTLAGFGVRSLPSGRKSFILYRIFGRGGKATRRSLGEYGSFSAAEIERRKTERAETGQSLPLGSIMSLAEARELAHTCLVEISRGRDPWREAARAKEAASAASAAVAERLVGKVLDDYARHKRDVRGLRTIDTTESELRRELKPWLSRDITEIGEKDVRALVSSIQRRGKHAQARVVLNMTKTFFNWAVDAGVYDLKVSPAASFRGDKMRALAGERIVRTRTLRDVEIRAFWRAAEVMAYPFGRLFQFLLLTAQRRDEVANAKWSELDLDNKAWVIPGARMKLKHDHYVPLTDDAVALLRSLPRGTGDHVFSSNGGHAPVAGFSQSKKRLDALMRRELEAEGASLEDWRLHDLRRTARSHFSSLAGVKEETAERLLDHAPKGMSRVYNLHAFRDEKADCLQKWHAKLKLIIEPQNNVVAMLRASA